MGGVASTPYASSTVVSSAKMQRFNGSENGFAELTEFLLMLNVYKVDSLLDLKLLFNFNVTYIC